VLGNLHVGFFRADRAQDDIAPAVIGNQRHERRQTERKYRSDGKGRARPTKRIEIKIIDSAADEQKK
jgi:hypothetical protein